MLTRKGLDWTARFHPIAEALAGLKAPNAYVDGEIAVVGEDGVTSFAELQAVPSTARPAAWSIMPSTSCT
jgi:bifunctional non-homologous end joining protein LigD